MRHLILFLALILPLSSFAEEFRMLTWNVYMLPKPLKFSNQNQREKAQALEMGKIQDELDLVVLNEAFTKGSKNSIAEAIKGSLPHTATLKRNGGITKVMDSGVAVMSRYPMKVLGEEYFKECAKADCFASKGVLLVEVSLPSGKKVQVAATHMQSGGKEKQVKIRESQLTQIKDLLKRHSSPGVPQVLAGDLNIDSAKKTEFLKTLDHLGMTTVSPEGDIQTSKSMSTSCFGQKDGTPTAWKDHILLGENDSTTKIVNKMATPLKGLVQGSECDLSDHLPVRATLEIKNNGSIEENECLPEQFKQPDNLLDLLKIPLIES